MSEIAKDRRTRTREEAILLQFRQVSKKQQEIADAVGVTQKTVDNRLESLVNLDRCPKLLKIAFISSISRPLFCRRYKKSWRDEIA